MYVQPTNYTQNPKTQTPKPQTPYGQIIIVNKIYYSYLHVKSGAVCPWASVNDAEDKHHKNIEDSSVKYRVSS